MFLALQKGTLNSEDVHVLLPPPEEVIVAL